jgi:hypothetical protein
MNKLILIFTIALLLASPAIVLAQRTTDTGTTSSEEITFKDPTVIPHNLDELYSLIQNHKSGWSNVSDCSQKGLTGSYFKWSMVKAIEAHSLNDDGQSLLILPAADLAKIVAPGGITFPSKGTLKVTEKTLFGALIQEVLNGKVLVCQQKDDLTIYGSGAQSLFDQLVPFVE